MKRDAIYARYSSHAQDDGTSIEVQIEQCERAAGAACTHYIDRAKTGRAMGGRAELLRLLDDAAAGKLARVFVYKFDRLGRAADTHVIAQQLDDAGVQLVSATEGTNALARGIQLVVAEDYSRQLAQRTRDGLLKRFEQSAFTGGVAPYGYRVVDQGGRRVLETHPDEADVVRDVTRWYLTEAVGFKSIAKRLRERGIGSRRGAGWCFTSVRSLLLNPILTGCVRYNARRMQLDRRTGRRVPRWKATGEHRERQDEALRIISDADFAEIQQRIAAAARGHATRNTPLVAPFTGLVHCDCGAKCYRVKSENRKGCYSYYVCSRHLRYADCPHAGRVREDALTTMVQDRFRRAFEQSEKIIARAVELATAAARGNRDDANRLKRELATVDGRQTRLVALLVDPDIAPATKQALNRQIANAETERADLLSALDRLREDANMNTEELAQAVREAFAEARESLAMATAPDQFNRFVERFVGPMTVKAGGDVVKREPPAADAAGGLTGCIAGGGFEPPTSGL